MLAQFLFGQPDSQLIAIRTTADSDLANQDATAVQLVFARNRSITDLDNLPEPDVLAEAIMENLRSAPKGLRFNARTMASSDSLWDIVDSFRTKSDAVAGRGWWTFQSGTRPEAHSRLMGKSETF